MDALDANTTLRLLRYLGGEANPHEVATLDALLLENEGTRAALLELAWQAQCLRELATEAPARSRQIPTRLIAAVAAVACLTLLSLVLRREPAPPITRSSAPSPQVDWTACFEREVSWNDVYSSALLYPRFVWNQLLRESPTAFPTFEDDLPLLALGAPTAHAHSFDHIHVIPLPDSLAAVDSGAFPTL